MPLPLLAIPKIAKVAIAVKKAKTAAKTAAKIGAAGKAVSMGANALEKATGGSGENEASKAADSAASAASAIGGAKDTYEDMRRRLEESAEISDEALKEILSDAGLPPGVPADWGACEMVSLDTGKTCIDVNETILDQLATHVYNHIYTYKKEAKELDESIDTETPQVGPTAQEIEKVNPAAVMADPETGAKIVDTPKLTMTIAGALAELARKTKRLEARMDYERERERADRKEEDATVYLGTWGEAIRNSPTNRAVSL